MDLKLNKIINKTHQRGLNPHNKILFYYQRNSNLSGISYFYFLFLLKYNKINEDGFHIDNL